MKDALEVVETYILLFLGVENKPIPSILHLEKEFFILSNYKPFLKEFFVFSESSIGPFSDLIRDLVEYPTHLDQAWEIENGRIKITKKGEKLFNKVLQKYEKDKEFIEILEVIKNIRRIIERMDKKDLLFLFQIIFPNYFK